VSKVLILITAPAEPESNVSEGSTDQGHMETSMPDPSDEDNGLESRFKDDDQTVTFFHEVDALNRSPVCILENGTAVGQEMPNTELTVGAGDIDDNDKSNAGETSKPDTSNRGKMKIQNSPSSSTAAHKKHCGTGCCIVS
jgi:hypothetical protein